MTDHAAKPRKQWVRIQFFPHFKGEAFAHNEKMSSYGRNPVWLEEERKTRWKDIGDHMVMAVGKEFEFYSKPNDKPLGYFGEINSIT